MPAGYLPSPNLAKRELGEILVYTDDALFQQTGVRIAFTGRSGGVSEGAFGGLNLGTHVNDDPAAVAVNRQVLMTALGVPDAPLLVPNQVHGANVVRVEGVAGAEGADALSDELQRVRAEIAEGCDALVVEPENVAACLCFADCLPVILVASSGRFAVAHAGWRGAVAGIAGLAARNLANAQARETGETPESVLAGMNAFIGPYIHVECFETGADVAQRFEDAFGADCVHRGSGQDAASARVDLGRAVSIDLVSAGLDPERIADVQMCTKCNPEEFFSYRASGGVCGRHGAAAVRKKG